MGIDVDSSLIVGASYGELEDFFEKIIELGETSQHLALDDAREVIEQYFDYASPYYDSSPDTWFIGFDVKNYQNIGDDLFNNLKELKDKFESLTGVTPRLRCGCHVW